MHDLNLLHSLDALLRDGSVTGAAQRVRITTPAMSRALGRLRVALKDPLLVRAGRGMVLTPYAQSLRERVALARESANAVLSPASHAPTATLERTLVIRSSDAVAALFAAPLYERALQDAPRLRLLFVQEGEEDAAALREGRVDLDVGDIGSDGPELRTRGLVRDVFVSVSRRGHVIGRRKLTPGLLSGFAHIVVSRRGRARGPIDTVLAERGLERTIAAVVPNFLAAVWVAANSELLATVPGLLARRAKRLMPIEVRAFPFELPSLNIGMAWHPRTDADPACRWLREQVVQLSLGA